MITGANLLSPLRGGLSVWAEGCRRRRSVVYGVDSPPGGHLRPSPIKTPTRHPATAITIPTRRELRRRLRRRRHAGNNNSKYHTTNTIHTTTGAITAAATPPPTRGESRRRLRRRRPLGNYGGGYRRRRHAGNHGGGYAAADTWLKSRRSPVEVSLKCRFFCTQKNDNPGWVQMPPGCRGRDPDSTPEKSIPECRLYQKTAQQPQLLRNCYEIVAKLLRFN